MLEDCRYRITATVPHFASLAALLFGSSVSTYDEAAWSLDNLVVISSTSTGSRLVVSPQAGTGKLNLRVQSQPGVNVTIRRSSDFVSWPLFQSVFNQAGETTLEVDAAQLGSPVFFRAGSSQTGVAPVSPGDEFREIIRLIHRLDWLCRFRGCGQPMHPITIRKPQMGTVGRGSGATGAPASGTAFVEELLQRGRDRSRTLSARLQEKDPRQPEAVRRWW